MDSCFPLDFLEIVALTDFERGLPLRDIDRFFEFMETQGQLATDLVTST